MLNAKVEQALNAQINAEFWSAYLYLSMSADAMQKGYKGIANWFSVQFQEEQAHAQILISLHDDLRLLLLAEHMRRQSNPCSDRCG